MGYTGPMVPVFFPDSEAFGNWLAANHASEKEIWVGYYRKDSGLTGITYGDSLDQALCWGWIDGQIRSHDELSFKRRFTPRKVGSVWSAANVDHVERLISGNRMRPPGLAAVEAARADGRWAAAYQGQKTIAVPPDLAEILGANPGLQAFFDGLTSANRYAFLYRLETARTPETRAKRLGTVKAMLLSGKTYH